MEWNTNWNNGHMDNEFRKQELLILKWHFHHFFQSAFRTTISYDFFIWWQFPPNNQSWNKRIRERIKARQCAHKRPQNNGMHCLDCVRWCVSGDRYVCHTFYSCRLISILDVRVCDSAKHTETPWNSSLVFALIRFAPRDTYWRRWRHTLTQLSIDITALFSEQFFFPCHTFWTWSGLIYTEI